MPQHVVLALRIAVVVLRQDGRRQVGDGALADVAYVVPLDPGPASSALGVAHGQVSPALTLQLQRVTRLKLLNQQAGT